MLGNRYYKKYIDKLIAVNPVSITIKRKQEVDDGYGGVITTPITINETVVFYDHKARREIISEYGSSYTGVNITKILTRGDADIERGDKFEANNNQYQVLLVVPYFDICKQVEVEVIK